MLRIQKLLKTVLSHEVKMKTKYMIGSVSENVVNLSPTACKKEPYWAIYWYTIKKEKIQLGPLVTGGLRQVQINCAVPVASS